LSKNSLAWLCLLIIFLSPGCQPKEHPELWDDSSHERALQETINDYLVENISITGFSGEAYCAYELLNTDRGSEGELYVWTLCQEYYLEQGSLTEGSGVSLPVALQTQGNNNQIHIIGHLVPRDGSYYGPDVRTIFPKSTWPQIMPETAEESDQYNFRANELMKETRMKARLDYELNIKK
jgi:hypothetical protein